MTIQRTWQLPVFQCDAQWSELHYFKISFRARLAHWIGRNVFIVIASFALLFIPAIVVVHHVLLLVVLCPWVPSGYVLERSLCPFCLLATLMHYDFGSSVPHWLLAFSVLCCLLNLSVLLYAFWVRHFRAATSSFSSSMLYVSFCCNAFSVCTCFSIALIVCTFRRLQSGYYLWYITFCRCTCVVWTFFSIAPVVYPSLLHCRHRWLRPRWRLMLVSSSRFQSKPYLIYYHRQWWLYLRNFSRLWTSKFCRYHWIVRISHHSRFGDGLHWWVINIHVLSSVKRLWCIANLVIVVASVTPFRPPHLLVGILSHCHYVVYQ